MIEVLSYDPAWAIRFERLRSAYEIDVDLVVHEADVVAASEVLVAVGFEPRGELGIPQRWAFYEPDRFTGTNTYVIVQGTLSLRNHLAVRDILREDAALRDEYSAVKQHVGATAADIYEYGQGKNAMVQRILEAAGLSETDRASVGANQVPVTWR